jgi:hypothetical protein
MRARLHALFSILALFAVAPAQCKDFYFWTQFAESGVEARAVVEDGLCPQASIDGRETKMTVRAAANDAFPVTVCALGIPKGAVAAALDGRPLALPRERIDRILLVGDTGCRLNALALQGCNALKTWPFRLVADLAAEAAPDLVIHVGDLIYRERACPPDAKACAGSPHGDNYETWKADWFEPAEALLEAAPIVFVRGNHEDCARNWRGWTRFASAFPFARSCAPVEPPFFVGLGGLTLAVLDVVQAEDRAVDDTLSPLLESQFAGLASRSGPLWIAMHKPVYGVTRVKDGVVEGDNKTLAAAVRGALPQNVEALLSGHLHVFEAMSYVQDFPAQIIAGTGGDLLDAFAPERVDGLRVGDKTIEKGVGAPNKFGYATLERQGDGLWLVQDYDAHGARLARCRLDGRKLSCD